MIEAKQNKQNKQQKRSELSPWRALTVWSLIFAIGCWIIMEFFIMADNPCAVFVAGSRYKLVNEDKNAIYYPADFETEEEMLTYGAEISRLVEAEGAVLLKNDNHALPLSDHARVSCFSTSSVNLVCGGTGSGAIDTSAADNLKEALDKVGVSVNETLWDFYESGKASKYSRGRLGYHDKKAEIYEAPWDIYTDEVLASVEQYGDAAIVVLSRSGGAEKDQEYTDFNYLALDANEHALLKNVCKLKEEGKIRSVVVLINSSNAIEMSFLDTYDIDACMHIGVLGEHGVNGVADLLVGNVNPSGSLADTFCYEYFSAPAMWNFSAIEYANPDKYKLSGNADTYMIYQEGIYIGYRYYETRYADYVMGIGNAGEYDYSSVVMYPFGYGLSYTEFSYDDMQVSYDPSDDQFEVRVTVTNIGECAGKETVQIYGQSPYTDYDRKHGVEKSAVFLCGYGKTKILEPGDSATVTILVNKRDFASFDTYGAGTYIMDAGDYYLTAAVDAHAAVNQILGAKGYTIENTNGRMTAEDDVSLTWRWTEDSFDAQTYSVSENGAAITSKLSDADPNLYDGVSETVTWLSRADWMNTFPKEPIQLTLTKMLAEALRPGQYDPVAYNSVGYEMPTMEEDNGLGLYDMIGKDFDAPEWQLLLDQLSYDDMVTLVVDAFHGRTAVESVQAPGTRDENGPSGLNTIFIAEDIASTTFPSENMMASSFNDELIYAVGNVLGNNCLMAGIDCLYGPGANMHRTAYGGRNFEYYSEDPFLTAQICAAEVKGLEDLGIHTILKHFALNDCEADRMGLGVWLNEQTAREIYLKAFQSAFEKSDANGVMAAYTRWGAVWSGGYRNLITGILREEWGCSGWIISDNTWTSIITVEDGLIGGLTTFDAPFLWFMDTDQYQNDPLIVTKMREACHINLYALANSAAMNGIGENTVVELTEYFFIPIFRWLTVGFVVLFAVSAWKWYKRRIECKERAG